MSENHERPITDEEKLLMADAEKRRKALQVRLPEADDEDIIGIHYPTKGGSGPGSEI